MGSSKQREKSHYRFLRTRDLRCASDLYTVSTVDDDDPTGLGGGNVTLDHMLYLHSIDSTTTVQYRTECRSYCTASHRLKIQYSTAAAWSRVRMYVQYLNAGASKKFSKRKNGTTVLWYSAARCLVSWAVDWDYFPLYRIAYQCTVIIGEPQQQRDDGAPIFVDFPPKTRCTVWSIWSCILYTVL